MYTSQCDNANIPIHPYILPRLVSRNTAFSYQESNTSGCATENTMPSSLIPYK